jgi:hypothetical protein
MDSTPAVAAGSSPRTLRRADWRFLLPRPQFHRALSLADGRLADAVALVSDVVEPRAQDAEAYDLLVVRNPTLEVLRAGVQRLESEGCCYVEWTRGHTRRARHGAELCKALGLDVEMYWPWPSFEEARVWFPLSRPELAVQHFRRDVMNAHGAARRAWRRLRLAACRVRLRLPYGVGISTVAYRPAAPGRNAAQPLARELSCRWSRWGLGPPTPRVSLVMHAGGSHDTNKLVSFAFADQDVTPAVVVKQARTAAAATGLARERDALRTVHGSAARGDAGIPRVLLWRQSAGWAALCQSAMPGVPLSAGLVQTRYDDLVRAATDWLIRRAVDTRHDLGGPRWTSIRAAALKTFRRQYGTAIEPAVAAGAEAAVQCAPAPPGVFEHRDLSPWNVLLDGHCLSVLDWESSEPRGVAGLDLIYFLTHLMFYREGVLGTRFGARCGTELVKAYESTWDDTTFAGRINCDALSMYARALSLDERSYPALRVLTWVTHSAAEFERLSGAGLPLTDGLFVNLLRAEIAAAASGSAVLPCRHVHTGT